MLDNLFSQFTQKGLLHRSEVKNFPEELYRLLQLGYTRKRHYQGKVFYELTPKALPLLNDYRHTLLHRAQLHAKLHPRSQFYKALLNDLRFFDDKKKDAQDFLFLGDWQLKREPTAAQLELCQHLRLKHFLDGDNARTHEDPSSANF